MTPDIVKRLEIFYSIKLYPLNKYSVNLNILVLNLQIIAIIIIFPISQSFSI